MISRINTTLKTLNKVEKKAYALLAINIIIISFLTIFALQPSLFVVASMLNSYGSALKEDFLITKKIEDLNSAKQILLRNKEKSDLLNNAIPNTPEQDRLVKKLTYMVFKRNLFLTATEIIYTKNEDINQDSKIQEVALKLEVKGDMNSIFGFIEDLQKDTRLFSVDKVLTRKADKKTTANIYLRAFYFK